MEGQAARYLTNPRAMSCVDVEVTDTPLLAPGRSEKSVDPEEILVA